MTEFLAFTLTGIVTGSIYAVAAGGLVLTYSASGVFNIAHGAVGMIMAFAYWQLRFDWRWPAPIALIVVIGILAPLMGMGIERFMIRRIPPKAVLTWLMVTVGLMVGLIGFAQLIWKPNTSRYLPGFFGSGGTTIFSVFLTWHQICTLVIAGLIAGGLRIFLYGTRIGLSMRAVVDNRPLVSLNGGRPAYVGALSWALGSSLAAIAGILIAPSLQLNHVLLTLLVISAYAAAAVGRLTSLPLTFAGSLVLGLLQSYAVGYLPSSNSNIVQGLRLSIPTLLLFIALLILPEVRVRAARTTTVGRRRAVPTLRTSVISSGGLVALVAALAVVLSSSDVIRLGTGLSTAIIVLSFVPLTGYAGQISLCHMTFAGVGAFAAVKVGAGHSVWGLVVAAAAAGAVGVLVAIPGIRIRGLYLALSTMAFAVLMDNMFFNDQRVFGFGGAVPLGRLHLPFVSFDSDRSFVVLLAVVFSIAAIGVLALRRGPWGRRLVAMNDSELGCVAMGVSTVKLKLAVFALSAAMAGLGGALFAEFKTVASGTDFAMIASLPILLVIVIQGVDMVTGALLAGLGLTLISLAQAALPGLGSLTFLATGLAGIALGAQPDGVLPGIAEQLRALRTRLRARAASGPKRLGVASTAADSR